MQYLTYAEYIELGGMLSEREFDRYELQARKQFIDRVSFNRISRLKVIPEDVKQCAFELIDRIELQNQKRSCNKQSESNDGVSITYKPADETVFQNDCILLVTSYLGDCRTEDGTPLTYRGIAKCDIITPEVAK